MRTEESNIKTSFMGIHKWFRRISDKEIYVKSSCVFTENPYHLRVGEIYEIHDLSREGIHLGYIKLLWVYLKGMTFHVIGVDIQDGDFVHLSQRLGNDSSPCDFLICDLLYFDEDMSTKILRGLTADNMELLEFDFGQEHESS